MTVTTHRERAMLLRQVEGRTLLDVFLDGADLHGPQAALVAKQGDAFRTRTWADYRAEARQLAAGLQQAAVRPGDRVALAVGNRPEHAVADVGLLLAGAVPVPVQPGRSVAELRAILDACPLRRVIIDDAAAGEVWQQVAPDLPRTVVDGAGDTPDGSLAGLIEAGGRVLASTPTVLDPVREQVQADDPAVVVVDAQPDGAAVTYTVTHRSLLFQLAGLATRLQLEPGVRVAAYLPLADIGARVTGHYLALRFGGSVAFVQEPWQLLEVLLEHRPQLIFSPPQTWAGIKALVLAGIDGEEDERRRKVALKAVEIGNRAGARMVQGGKLPTGLRVKHRGVDQVVFAKMRDRLGLDEMRWALVAGYPVAADLAAFYRGIGIELLEGWVAPAAGGFVSVNPAGAAHLGTVGEVLPGTEVQTGRDGEVRLRSPQLSPDAPVDESGWWATGRLGVTDRGYLQALGPAADVLTVQDGTRVVPLRVERAIADRSPVVAHVCLVEPGRAVMALDADLLPLWCMQQGIAFTTLEAAAGNLRILGEIQRAVDEANRELGPAEQVHHWSVDPTGWTEDGGELSPYLEVRRPVVRARQSTLSTPA